MCAEKLRPQDLPLMSLLQWHTVKACLGTYKPCTSGNAPNSEPATMAHTHKSPARQAHGSPARQAYSKGLMRHGSPARQAIQSRPDRARSQIVSLLQWHIQALFEQARSQIVNLLQWHTQPAHRVQIQFF